MYATKKNDFFGNPLLGDDLSLRSHHDDDVAPRLRLLKEQERSNSSSEFVAYQSSDNSSVENWFDDLKQIEKNIEEISTDDDAFRKELEAIGIWFSSITEYERMTTIYSLLPNLSRVQLRFFMTVLQQRLESEPFNRSEKVLSPIGSGRETRFRHSFTGTHMDKVRTQESLGLLKASKLNGIKSISDDQFFGNPHVNLSVSQRTSSGTSFSSMASAQSNGQLPMSPVNSTPQAFSRPSSPLHLSEPVAAPKFYSQVAQGASATTPPGLIDRRAPIYSVVTPLNGSRLPEFSEKAMLATFTPSKSTDSKSDDGKDHQMNLDLLHDLPSWLKSLRLHKYTPNFKNMRWQEMVNLTDEQLEKKGVAALGARRKMLKVFEQIKEAKQMH